ncbi:MAG TPA: phage major capsid protein [Thermomicrobiales bacterium]|nr:phage major capsid protein [Thermomicrobiales bacterium]
MALTLTEAAKLTQDLLLRGVIETIVSESQLLNYLPFMDVTGNALTYNQENALATASYYGVGDTWLEDTPTFTQKTAKLAILGGDADVDNFLQQTYSDPNDLAAAVIAAKAKAVARTFSDTFFNGDTAVTPKGYDGLHKLIPAGQRLKANNDNANGGALTLDDVDKVIDLVKPGKPDALFLSKRTRRKLKSLRRNAANVMEVDIDQFGRRVEFYDGIPLVIDDFILDNHTVGASAGICSTLYAVQFGYQRGVMGIHNGGVQVDTVGDLETKDATRHRVKWYSAIVCFRDIAAAALEGITNA